MKMFDKKVFVKQNFALIFNMYESICPSELIKHWLIVN